MSVLQERIKGIPWLAMLSGGQNKWAQILPFINEPYHIGFIKGDIPNFQSQRKHLDFPKSLHMKTPLAQIYVCAHLFMGANYNKAKKETKVRQTKQFTNIGLIHNLHSTWFLGRLVGRLVGRLGQVGWLVDRLVGMLLWGSMAKKATSPWH